jgi:hypothetical protein
MPGRILAAAGGNVKVRAAQWDPTHRKVRDEWGTRPKWPVREICLAYPYCVLIHFTDAEELPA